MEESIIGKIDLLKSNKRTKILLFDFDDNDDAIRNCSSKRNQVQVY